MNDKQRAALKQYVFECAMSSMFGDGMEDHYAKNGFPEFKGVNKMTDAELLTEAGCGSEPEAVKEFLAGFE